jgi:very-short-patch-repair endonuclease
MNEKNFSRLHEMAKTELAGILIEKSEAEAKPILGEYDSPIEEFLAVAMRAYIAATCSKISFEPILWGSLKELKKTPFPPGCRAFIQPQVSIYDYRVDFLAVIEGVGGTRKFIAIECDGHDFHEKTKDQAQRDKARDREIQSAGVEVHRFTGSEIWRAPFTVAYEIIERINDEIVGLMYSEYLASLSPEEAKAEAL